MKGNIITRIMKNIYNIFLKICIGIYRLIKYVWYGLVSPIVFCAIIVSKIILKRRELRLERLKKGSKKQFEKDKKMGKKKMDLSAYKDESVKEKVKRKNLFTLIASAIQEIPKSIQKRIDNNAIIKQVKNKKAFDTKTMLVDFSDEDKQNDGTKVVWEYIAINDKGKKIKGYFSAFSRVDVQSFLIGEGLAVYSIRTSKLIQLLHSEMSGNRVRIKTKDLIFMLTQLSTYLKSGIPLVESMNIVIRQTKNKNYKKILRETTYDLTVGESFSVAMDNRGLAFPKLLINMVKAAELTGELPESLDEMVEYYTEAEEVRKEMISALTYPSIVFLFTLAVLTFVMVYVVPKFVEIYNTMEAVDIPKITLIIISASEWLKANIIYIIIILVVVLLIIYYLYNKVKVIRTFMQWIFMHIPVIKDVIIYNEVTMFSKTFSSLLSHNVYITDSMDILNRITNNEIYKMMIMDTVANLARGEKISKAFENQWAFPLPAYEMIVTGEKTGQLAEMMGKVSTYYQSLHKNTVSKIKALLEPFLIVFLTFVVGIILLSIVVPMFSMYQQVQKLG